MNEHMSDVKFGKVFAGMLSGMVVLTIFLIILAYAVGGEAGSKRSDLAIFINNQETLVRTAPVGSITVGDVSEQQIAAVSTEAMSGDSVYQSSCAVCHAAGIAGAPKLDDVAAWEPRIAQGIEILYEHAIKGFNTMPAKGGNTSLSDDAVKAAVDYMTGQKSASQETGAEMQTAAASTEDSTQDIAAADSAAGQSVYEASCAVCHTAGVAGAPKYGDAGAWQPRIAQGVDALYQHSINGFNAMPAKGGNAALSDDDVKAAVDYMVNSAN